jgi:toxin YoeB
MIEEALRDPGQGMGKPERLTENPSGYWSRQITDERPPRQTVAELT